MLVQMMLFRNSQEIFDFLSKSSGIISTVIEQLNVDFTNFADEKDPELMSKQERALETLEFVEEALRIVRYQIGFGHAERDKLYF